MRKLGRLLTAAVFAAMSANAAAAPVLIITEIYSGITGLNGTNDWFELTNIGDMAANTGAFPTSEGDLALVYNDEIDIADAGTLDALVIEPGASAVFIVADHDGDVQGDPIGGVEYDNVFEEFAAVWGPIDVVGITNGGGGLNTGAESVNIGGDLFGQGLVWVPVLSQDYDIGGALQTMHVDEDGNVSLSVLGMGGAYQSNPFDNDNHGGDMVQLIGSPGNFFIPLPAMLPAFVIAVGGLAARRRA